jgi:alanine racemase
VTGAFGLSCRGPGDFPPPTLETLPEAVARNVACRVAQAAVAAGAEWLGTTDIAEASDLRAAGLTVPILTWLNPSGVDAEV